MQDLDSKPLGAIPTAAGLVTRLAYERAQAADGRDKTNTDWCILERDPEPRLAVGESAPGLDLLGNRLSE
jgi:hypothetical protein